MIIDIKIPIFRSQKLKADRYILRVLEVFMLIFLQKEQPAYAKKKDEFT